MVLNFGRFKGSTIESLKTTGEGVSYLEWGAENLRDPKLRKAFADTLAGMTDHEHAKIVAKEDQIGYDEALAYIQSMRAMEEEYASEEEKESQRKQEVIARWAEERKSMPDIIWRIAHQYMMNWESLPPTRFSSERAYEMFRCYMKELWG